MEASVALVGLWPGCGCGVLSFRCSSAAWSPPDALSQLVSCLGPLLVNRRLHSWTVLDASLVCVAHGALLSFAKVLDPANVIPPHSTSLAYRFVERPEALVPSEANHDPSARRRQTGSKGSNIWSQSCKSRSIFRARANSFVGIQRLLLEEFIIEEMLLPATSERAEPRALWSLYLLPGVCFRCLTTSHTFGGNPLVRQL